MSGTAAQPSAPGVPTPPPESAARGFVRNVLGSTAATFLTMVVSFLYVRYLIRTVGPTRFGVWTLAFSLAQYATVLDAGFLSAVRRYQSRALARNDLDESNAVLAVSLAIYAAIGLAALALCASAVGWLPHVVDTPLELRAELRVVLLVAGGYTLLSFVRSCFNGLLFGANRVDLSRLVMLVDRVAVAIFGVALLAAWRPDLMSPAAAAAGAGFISLASAVALARRVQPGLRVTVAWRPELARSMAVFSAGAMLLTIAGLTIEHVPKFVVGGVWGAAEVGLFSVPWLLVGYLFQATAPISSAVLPMAARVEAAGGRERLADLYVRASRGMLGLATAAAVPLAFYAGDFLAYFAGEAYRALAPVLVVLLGGEVFRVGQITGLHLLTASGSIRRLSIGQALSATAAIGGGVLLARGSDLGLVGVAAAVGASAAVFWGVYVPHETTRQLRMPFGPYLARAVLPALASAAVLAGICAGVRRLFVPTSLVESLAVLAVLGGVGLVVTAGVALDADDRRRLLAAIRTRV